MPALAIAKAFIRAINRRDPKAIVALMSPHHRFIDSLGATVAGAEAMRAGWAGYFKLVPDYWIRAERFHVAGSTVLITGSAGGTLSEGGVLDPAKRWSVPAAWRARVQGKRVLEWQVYADNEPLRQLMRRRKGPSVKRDNGA